MRRKWVPISAAALLIAGLAAGTRALRRRGQAPQAQPRTAGALTLPANSDTTVTGIIRPQHVVNVGSETPGVIEEFLADVGQEVYEGQSLARIGSNTLESVRENAASAAQRAEERVSRAETALNNARMELSRAGAELQRSNAAMNLAQQEYEKQRRFWSLHATSKNTYDKAEREYQDALDQHTLADKASNAAQEFVRSSERLADDAKKDLADKMQALQDAQEQVQGAEVRSPADGLIVARNGALGQMAQEVGDQMFLIATDVYALEVPLEPQPPLLNRLHPGMPAMVLAPQGLNAPIAGEIKTIQGATVIVQFASPVATIKPGMKAEVRFRLD